MGNGKHIITDARNRNARKLKVQREDVEERWDVLNTKIKEIQEEDTIFTTGSKNA